MKTFLLTLIIIIGFGLMSTTQAQSNYEQAIGARAAYGLSGTYKKFINDDAAIELIATYRNYGLSTYSYSSLTITGLYEVHNSWDSWLEGMAWYWGGGAYVGFWNGDFDFNSPDDDGSLFIGLAGVIGLDYTFANIPLNLSVDWIPGYNLNGFGNGFNSEAGGVAARYTF